MPLWLDLLAEIQADPDTNGGVMESLTYLLDAIHLEGCVWWMSWVSW